MAMHRRAARRRGLTVLSTAILVAALAPGWVPASAQTVTGTLVVTAVTDSGSDLGAPVAGRSFDVSVEVQDSSGAPLAVTRSVALVIEKVAGAGELSGTTSTVVPRGGSSATFVGLTLSAVTNGVELLVRATTPGVDLVPATIEVDVALSAVSRGASPRVPTSLSDPACPAPTAQLPTCGYLELPNGAGGRSVTLALTSCEGVPTMPPTPACRSAADGTTALVVLALADLKHEGEPLYRPESPAALVVACDKVLCGQGGVTSFPLLVDLTNTGPLREAPPCPRKGELGPGQQACVDYVQSRRDNAGDLYTYLLFDYDARASHP